VWLAEQYGTHTSISTIVKSLDDIIHEKVTTKLSGKSSVEPGQNLPNHIVNDLFQSVNTNTKISYINHDNHYKIIRLIQEDSTNPAEIGMVT
jgi:hypothetical protein